MRGRQISDQPSMAEGLVDGYAELYGEESLLYVEGELEGDREWYGEGLGEGVFAAAIEGESGG
jgi:hypothetical protein